MTEEDNPRPPGLCQMDAQCDFEQGVVDPDDIRDVVWGQLILGALSYYEGHRLNTAAALGRSRRWLWAEIIRLGLEEQVRKIDHPGETEGDDDG